MAHKPLWYQAPVTRRKTRASGLLHREIARWRAPTSSVGSR
ncbi:hypothetical protein BN931_344 [Bifidobacterium animalis subsp. lactis CECT 8145]|nr:hypothetical protein W91_1257 [Bifidobacterium animalis subsp. lactis Bi-07]AJD34341.1 hypothetical protein BAA6_1228 [Bifidobacterium animalis]QIR81261.1 hypothetical protein M8PIadj_1247 [Bifidobacterium animalis]CDL71156.1 hypothetical protein BN931_344 [Bifidobacterium animalis subsp. lactis CECT 8145]